MIKNEREGFTPTPTLFPVKSSKNNQPGLKLVWGFTLIELVITMSIFVLMTAVILANYSKLSQVSSLNRTAQEIVLALRKAQTFSLAVKGYYDTGSGALVFRTWGIHFEKNLSPSLLDDPTKQFVLFSDTSVLDYKYNGSAELSQLMKIQTSSRIVDLCGGLKTTTPVCNGLSWIDIVYQRPNPSITLNAAGTLNNYSDLEIIVESPDGTRRTIIVWNTGQVAIE